MGTFHSGFCVLVGAPNAGKSTLLNRLVGEKVAITSQKPQTTRNRILGVMHGRGSQVVFLDTPGIHRAKKPLNKWMVETAMKSIQDMDAVVLVADAARPSPDSESLVLNALKKHGLPAILALNKIDLLERPRLLPLLDQWSQRHAFAHLVPVSAQTGEQVDTLAQAVTDLMPQGPPYYPEDTLTDMPEKFVAAEMVREKVFRLTGQEIPYATAVTVEEFHETAEPARVHLRAVIHVERDSQKGILIGKGGTLLKRIGTEARKDMERMLARTGVSGALRARGKKLGPPGPGHAAPGL